MHAESEELVNMKQSYRIGRISRVLDPGLGWCLRCRTTWMFVKWHSTAYRAHFGCFPLCEKCWSELTVEQRLPFYRQLINARYEKQTLYNGATFDETWTQVEAAVRSGL